MPGSSWFLCDARKCINAVCLPTRRSQIACTHSERQCLSTVHRAAACGGNPLDRHPPRPGRGERQAIGPLPVAMQRGAASRSTLAAPAGRCGAKDRIRTVGVATLSSRYLVRPTTAGRRGSHGTSSVLEDVDLVFEAKSFSLYNVIFKELISLGVANCSIHRLF